MTRELKHEVNTGMYVVSGNKECDSRGLVPPALPSAWPLPTLLHHEDGCLGATSR